MIQSHYGEIGSKNPEAIPNPRHASRPGETPTSQSREVETQKPAEGTKRKWDCATIISHIMRPSKEVNGGTARPKLWLVPDTADTYPHARDGRRLAGPTPVDPNWDNLWTTAGKTPRFGHEAAFEFTSYPKGLADRYRPTNIFPEQRYEWIMPELEWKTVHENWKDKSVTMSFLAYERKELRRRAKDKR